MKQNSDWRTYVTDEGDSAGRRIDRIYARDKGYVIYFSGSDMFYEAEPDILKTLGSADVELGRINSLLPAFPKKESNLQRKISLLELAADAYEAMFCGHVAEGMKLLSDLRERLEAGADGVRRLYYQTANLVITLAAWICYAGLLKFEGAPEGLQAWFLAATLGLTGGVLSVSLNVTKLQVSISQKPMFLLCAGATRSIIALLAGVVVLLAMRSNVFATLAYAKETLHTPVDKLILVEMFFCFLAGFSETLVPNILRDAEKTPSGESAKPKPPTDPKPSTDSTGNDQTLDTSGKGGDKPNAVEPRK